MTDVNLAIIGSGYISSRYLQNAPLFKGVKIVAVADIVPELAQGQAARFGVEALSVDAVLRRDDIDAVINLTVPDAHFEVSFAALTAGKHVFSEKPLTVSIPLARKLVDEAEARAGVRRRTGTRGRRRASKRSRGRRRPPFALPPRSHDRGFRASLAAAVSPTVPPGPRSVKQRRILRLYIAAARNARRRMI